MKRSNLLFSLFVAALVFNTDLSAQRRGGGGNYGGGNRNVRSSANSSVNRNYNQNTNVNRNVSFARTLTLREVLTSITARWRLLLPSGRNRRGCHGHSSRHGRRRRFDCRQTTCRVCHSSHQRARLPAVRQHLVSTPNVGNDDDLCRGQRAKMTHA